MYLFCQSMFFAHTHQFCKSGSSLTKLFRVACALKQRSANDSARFPATNALNSVHSNVADPRQTRGDNDHVPGNLLTPPNSRNNMAELSWAFCGGASVADLEMQSMHTSQRVECVCGDRFTDRKQLWPRWERKCVRKIIN